MNRFCILLCMLVLAGCASKNIKPGTAYQQMAAEVSSAAATRAQPAPDTVSQALIPPLVLEMPRSGASTEPKFDLVVNHAPANQVFMAIVSGTRYSMLVHPDVKEPISVNLKDVTVPEALEAVRELYGYEYKVQANRIFVQPLGIQTRVFQVNYLMGRRQGRADVRVTSGSIQSPALPFSGAATAGTGGVPVPVTGGGGTSAQSIESSRVTTTSDNDYWPDLARSLTAIVGTADGRGVVLNQQSGVIVVRALPREIRSVENFLKQMQIIIDRQVMLEAKIIDVQLNDAFQSGINWAAFRTGNNSRFSAGQLTPGTTLRTDGSLMTSTGRAPDGSLLPGATLGSDPARSLPLTPDPLSALTAATGSITSAIASGANTPGGVFGLAFQSASFAALLSFLETQGAVHVLSSPRIATLNNQKAVLKVGTDELFVTNISTSTTTTGTTSTVSPTITVQPFFSGIALDVTPQIAEDNQIILHIHPSVSAVTDKTKTLSLGALGTFTLPLASSNVNESDTIVRVQDGSIVAIGGLMKQSQTDNRSQLPGIGDVPVFGNLFRSSNQNMAKSELVILLKTTVIHGEQTWQQQAMELDERMQTLQRLAPPPRTSEAGQR
jgi:MSHA biogenesis protein MshL